MPGNEIPDTDSTSPSAPEQGLSAWLKARVDTETRDEVTKAFKAFGFESTSDGLRLVLRAFARSPEVRDAVRDSLHLAVLDAPSG